MNDKRFWIAITLLVQHVRDLVGRQALLSSVRLHEQRERLDDTNRVQLHPAPVAQAACLHKNLACDPGIVGTFLHFLLFKTQQLEPKWRRVEVEGPR